MGHARALLLVLRLRGISVGDASVQRIERERDEARLDTWTRRAVTANSIEDVFTDE